MAKVGELVFEMSANIARLQSDMAKAKDTVTDATQSIQGAVEATKQVFEALAASEAIRWTTELVSGAIEAQNKLYELSESTGTTVEALSALRGVARESGTEMDTVATGTQRLSRAMLEAESGHGKAAQAFKVLGVSINDATGAMRPAQEVMQDVAVKLSEMGNKTEAVALAQEIFGRSGAQLLPFLNALAEAGKLNSTVSTEAAKAAHDYEVNLAKLGEQSELLKESFANSLLPSLTAATKAMLDAKAAGEGLFGVIGAGLSTALGGSDNLRNQKELISITEKQLQLKDQLDAAKRFNADNGPTFAGPDVAAIQAQLDAVNAQIKTALAYRKVLDDQTAAEERAAAAKEAARQKADAAMKAALAGFGKKAKTGDDEVDPEWQRIGKELNKEVAESARDIAKAKKEQADAEQRLQDIIGRGNDAVAKEVERYERLADPMREYREELERIDQLQASGDLDSDTADTDRAAIRSQMWAHPQSISNDVQQTDGLARQLGTSLASTFDRAGERGTKLRQVLQGIDADIAKILERKLITEPLGNALSTFLGGTQGNGASGITNPLMNVFGGGTSMGGAGGDLGNSMPDMVAGALAGGGSADFGQTYLVGENGPELFSPGSSGTVIPNDALGNLGGGGDHYHVHLNALDLQSSITFMKRNVPMVQAAVKSMFTRAGMVSPGSR